MQFDERSIADPLTGSVHDPIYHGAGSYGQAGVPQPKPGAVTQAHGGVLFIDEIGELHSSQMNKLLKILEDRKVIMSSSYYSKSNKNIPKHIHDIFNNGFPADFRLIGATTKRPEDIPAALRSRCREIFFKPLSKDNMNTILINAIKKAGMECSTQAYKVILNISENGRDIVNIVQSAASQAVMENRKTIELSDINDIWENNSRYDILNRKRDLSIARIGVAAAPVIDNCGRICMIEIEAAAVKSYSGMPQVSINAIAQSEEIIYNNKRILKKSTAASSVCNALAALKTIHALDYNDYDIFVDFASPFVVDDPSVGCAVFCAVYSSIMGIPLPSNVAFAGEISITGSLKPTGNVFEKIAASKEIGINTIFIPSENLSKPYDANDISVVEINSSYELIDYIFSKEYRDKCDDKPKLKIIHAFPSNIES